MGGSACLFVWLKYCFLMILLLHMYWDFRVGRFDRGVKIFIVWASGAMWVKVSALPKNSDLNRLGRNCVWWRSRIEY